MVGGELDDGKDEADAGEVGDEKERRDHGARRRVEGA
jgi:hypothetical protein